jgi:hypothetical protein
MAESWLEEGFLRGYAIGYAAGFLSGCQGTVRTIFKERFGPLLETF